MNGTLMDTLFHFDVLSWVMMGLVAFVGLCVSSFSSRYLKGDRAYSRFFILLGLMIACVLVMVCANHVALFLAAWAMSNALLVALMIYKPGWKAAYNSGWLAAKAFALGFVSLASGVAILAFQSGQNTLQGMIYAHYDPVVLSIALGLIFIGAMSQSAIWPFHKWLISSLNSPTPVSAIMHAGLVNGGGFLLARFAPLYFVLPDFLTIIFIFGIVTAVLGTLWKLMQSDIKRMLACSTMGQMGFMIAQCGMGLFPAAVAHLCWHGLFKAYLFLASGSAAQEKRLDLHYPPSMKAFASALLCGLMGGWAFSALSEKSLFAGDTTLVLIVLVVITSTQFSLPMIRNGGFGSFVSALVSTVLFGALYGVSVHAMEGLLKPLGISQPQELSGVYYMGLGVLVLSWLGLLFGRVPKEAQACPEWILSIYVRMLNASQPHPTTVTAQRSHYKI